ncbi:hypothetical protein [Frankia sp. EAN1pec]|uniref:hypothetical protein n=1 Tax=Parafrankia sp. (strain EAN1pec) TaxID=298653 RepID=UPI0000541EB7
MPVGLDTGFRMIGSRFSPDSRRLREFACRNRLPYCFVDLGLPAARPGVPIRDVLVVGDCAAAIRLLHEHLARTGSPVS